MDDKQLREESADSASLHTDPFIADCFFPGHHICPQCGEQLVTVECTDSCPHYAECPDYQQHESAGRFWCTTLKEEETA